MYTKHNIGQNITAVNFVAILLNKSTKQGVF